MIKFNNKELPLLKGSSIAKKFLPILKCLAYGSKAVYYLLRIIKERLLDITDIFNI